MNVQEQSVQIALQALKLAVELHKDHWEEMDTQPFLDLLGEADSAWQSSTCY